MCVRVDVLLAPGVDPADHALAERQDSGERSPRDPGSSGGIPPVRHFDQTPQGGGEGGSGDALSHAADQAPPQQQAGLRAFRGQAGVRRESCMEATRVFREGQAGVHLE